MPQKYKEFLKSAKKSTENLQIKIYLLLLRGNYQGTKRFHRVWYVGSLVCRQSVVHVPMILGKNCFRCALMRWVRTTPSFLFCDSPWLRHRVLHNGSSCQLLDGKPMAATLTLGYFASKDLNFVTKVLLGLMVCKK